MSELRSGERQVADTLDGIRADHRARYEWVRERVAGQSVVDAACGVGYGSAVLADAGCTVTAIDRSTEALDYAQQNWARPNVEYMQGELEDSSWVRPADAVVAFEVLEHLPEPEKALRNFRRMAEWLYVSVPNETVFPFKNYKFHHRHYTAEQLEDLLNRCGWEVQEWWGQTGPHSEVERNRNGRTLVAVCRKTDTPASGTHTQLDAPIIAPASVAIVAMGASCADYLRLCAANGGRNSLVDETWAINAMGGVIQHDILFHMDDVRIQERRVQAMQTGETGINAPVLGTMRWLKHHPGPVITSRAHPDYPGLVEMPVEEVVAAADTLYFNNTVAWAVGYALWQHKKYGVLRQLHLYGVDFSYPNQHQAEKGRGCVEFLLGKATERGIEIVLPQSSSLLDANVPQSEKVYGFDTENVRFERDENGRVRFIREPRKEDEIPTALEIEHRYRPPVQTKKEEAA